MSSACLESSLILLFFSPTDIKGFLYRSRAVWSLFVLQPVCLAVRPTSLPHQSTFPPLEPSCLPNANMSGVDIYISRSYFLGALFLLLFKACLLGKCPCCCPPASSIVLYPPHVDSTQPWSHGSGRTLSMKPPNHTKGYNWLLSQNSSAFICTI